MTTPRPWSPSGGGSSSAFNPRFLAYAGHHGFRPVACNVGAPQAKGRVEDAIKYLRGSFWPGRTFRDLADLNAQAQAWRDSVANQREHRVTRKIPSLLVAEERPHLLPLHAPYDTDEVRSVVVRPSCRVPFDGNRYSVPWRLVGKPLTLRADAETVSCWYDTHPVARHPRCWRRGVEVVNPAHTAGSSPRSRGSRRTGRCRPWSSSGRRRRQYLTLIRAGTRSLRAELDHLLLLTTVYGPAPVEAALAACLAQAIVGSHHVEQWLQLQAAPPVAPPPLPLADPASPCRRGGPIFNATIPCSWTRIGDGPAGGGGRRVGSEERPIMAPPTLEEKCTQLQLMSAPAWLTDWGARHPSRRPPSGRSSRPSWITSWPAGASGPSRRGSRRAKFVQVQTVDTFDFEYNGSTRKLRHRYLNLCATDLVAEGIGALFIGTQGWARRIWPGRSATPSASEATGCSSPPWPPW